MGKEGVTITVTYTIGVKTAEMSDLEWQMIKAMIAKSLGEPEDIVREDGGTDTVWKVKKK